MSSSSSMPNAFAFSGNGTCPSAPTLADKWIIDTGASKIMVCSLKHLTTVTNPIDGSVKLPDGSIAAVTHNGTIKLSTNLVLTNVLFVPCFKFNLISVSKLISERNCFLKFAHNYCFVQVLLT